MARTRPAAVRTHRMITRSPGIASRNKTVSTTCGTTAKSLGMAIQNKMVKKIQMNPNNWNISHIVLLEKWNGQDSIPDQFFLVIPSQSMKIYVTVYSASIAESMFLGLTPMV